MVPANAHFGAMIDCSRNGVMKPSEVKRLVDYLSLFGYQSLMLYTEDTFEVEGEPLFGYQRGRYTVKELQEIDAYCLKRGIELIPCVELLAHMNQLFYWQQYQDIRDQGDVLLVGEPRTYTLIEHIFQSLRKSFSSHKVHIGFDEAFGVGEGKYKAKHGVVDKKKIILEHLSKVKEIAHRYGFEVMMWADMFFDQQTIDEFAKTKKLPQEIAGKIPPDVTLVHWNYGNPWNEKRAVSNVNYFRRVLAPGKAVSNPQMYATGCWSWVGYAPRNRYVNRLNLGAMKAAKEAGIHDILVTLWSDNGKECSVFANLPSLYAAKRIYEGETRISVWKKEFFRLTGESFDAYMALDEINYLGTDDVLWVQNPSRWVIGNDPFFRTFDAYVLPGVAEGYQKLGRRLRRYGKKTKNPLLFEELSSLCAFFALKYDLGTKTVLAYQSRDKKEIEKLLPLYQKTQKALQRFWEADRALWNQENKMSGFEVHSARLGAMEARLKDCERWLEDYLSNKIESIEELEFPTVDINGCPPDKKPKELINISYMMGMTPNNMGW